MGRNSEVTQVVDVRLNPRVRCGADIYRIITGTNLRIEHPSPVRRGQKTAQRNALAICVPLVREEICFVDMIKHGYGACIQEEHVPRITK